MTKTVTNASFKHDANGLRTQKTVNMVMRLKRGSDDLRFFYDAGTTEATAIFRGAPRSA